MLTYFLDLSSYEQVLFAKCIRMCKGIVMFLLIWVHLWMVLKVYTAVDPDLHACGADRICPSILILLSSYADNGTNNVDYSLRSECLFGLAISIRVV